MRRVLGVVFGWLASLKLAVVLLVGLAVVLACTTVVEKQKGTEYVHWYVYQSRWFIALLGLLAANVLAAALIRFPWKRRHIGFLTTHGGVLVLLGGALQTHFRGMEGQLSFAEGKTADTIFITDRSLLEAVFEGQDDNRPTRFPFSPGPLDWPEGKTLEFEPADGISLKILGFYRHAREAVSWVADESGLGRPAIRFAFDRSDGQTISRKWLVASRGYGGVVVGPVKFELFTASAGSMLQDFLEPPLAGAGEHGVLSMHYQDQVYHVDVKENVGKKVPVGESGVSVEIVEYLADAARDAAGGSEPRGTEPRDPTLLLLVHLPDKDRPIRQIALARLPGLNLDEAHGGTCPVKFWYHHPAVSAELGLQFLQTPDGRLYCRFGAGGKYVSRGEVNEGDQIETWAGFSVSILKHVPHARREVTFQPVHPAPGEEGAPEAAALVEVTVEDETAQVWIKRNDREHGWQRIQTPRGPLLLTFGYEQHDLGFSLKLLDFKRGMNPGRVGDASFASSVQLVHEARGIDEKQEISMNKPLVHDKFTFYQSNFQQFADGVEVSILSVSHDPGRFLKYLGSLMTSVGIFAVFYLGPLSRVLRVLWARAADRPWERPATQPPAADFPEARSSAGADRRAGAGDAGVR